MADVTGFQSMRRDENPLVAIEQNISADETPIEPEVFLPMVDAEGSEVMKEGEEMAVDMTGIEILRRDDNPIVETETMPTVDGSVVLPEQDTTSQTATDANGNTTEGA